MKFDEVLDTIGGFGKFQRIQFALVSAPVIVVALHSLASVFITATPEFRCDTDNPEYSNITFAPNNGTDGCKVPIYAYDSNGTESTTEMKCDHYVYSTEYFYSTIVTKWDLVCDDKAKSTISTMVYMLGQLFGAFIFGLLSDVLGRKKTSLIGVLLVASCGTIAALSPNYYLFVAMRFIVAGSVIGLNMCVFVLGMELVGKTYRMVGGIVQCYFFASGYIILTAIAYVSKNWVYTQLAISAPVVLFLSYYWLMPESARWLMSREKTEEAMQIVAKAAKVNGVQLPDDFKLEQETATPTASLRELLTAKTLLCRSLIVFLNWFAVSMGYYGLSLNSGSLEGSIYVNFLLSGGIEFVSYTACFSINKLGRKGPHVFSMLLGGLACLATILVDQLATGQTDKVLNTYFVALNITGKFGITIGFAIIYIWSAELFPTNMRTSLLGLSSLSARIGGIIAPLIADLKMYVPGQYGTIIPALIIGVFVMASGLLSIALPETAGLNLPETVQEANNLGRKLHEQASINENKDDEFPSETKT